MHRASSGWSPRATLHRARTRAASPLTDYPRREHAHPSSIASTRWAAADLGLIFFDVFDAADTRAIDQIRRSPSSRRAPRLTLVVAAAQGAAGQSSIAARQITDGTDVGRSLITAADAAAGTCGSRVPSIAACSQRNEHSGEGVRHLRRCRRAHRAAHADAALAASFPPDRHLRADESGNCGPTPRSSLPRPGRTASADKPTCRCRAPIKRRSSLRRLQTVDPLSVLPVSFSPQRPRRWCSRRRPRPSNRSWVSPGFVDNQQIILPAARFSAASNRESTRPRRTLPAPRARARPAMSPDERRRGRGSAARFIRRRAADAVSILDFRGPGGFQQGAPASDNAAAQIAAMSTGKCTRFLAAATTSRPPRRCPRASPCACWAMARNRPSSCSGNARRMDWSPLRAAYLQSVVVRGVTLTTLGNETGSALKVSYPDADVVTYPLHRARGDR